MKFVYMFKEGNSSMRNLLGGKGANLCEMTRLNIPVPQGFVISTTACLDFYEKNGISENIKEQIFSAITKLEEISQKKFGDLYNPLLLSIRSGARVSMPGMMDTILNLGLNDKVVEAFAQYTDNYILAYDCYRRFIQMYGEVVKNIDSKFFERVIDKIKKQKNIKYDQEFTLDDLKLLVSAFKKIYKEKTNLDFPQNVKEQLINAIESVFKSWNNERAKIYRKLNHIPNDWGTAVNVQTMVFGNMNDQSGTGVCFSRNPATGENVFYGEFLMNAQGEDIVAGVRTPKPITELKKISETIYTELYNYSLILESFYKDMQDMEFTIENGKLFILQTRNGKRTTFAGLQIAIDLVKENEIDIEEALNRIEPTKLNEVLHNTLKLNNEKPICSGIPASPGGACGKIAFSINKAKKFVENGDATILVRLETSAEDIEGMSVASGVLTSRGGMTSHAAVVARGMGTVCVSGCEKLDFINNKAKIGSKIFNEGDYISIDGTTGYIYDKKIEVSSDIKNENFITYLNWAKERAKIKVFANVDSPKDLINSLSFLADGVGLCRTEHMFFKEDRIIEMQKMIIADNKKERNIALKNLLKFQKNDFTDMFKILRDKTLTIRLLDPPLHEFLPKTDLEIKELAKETETSIIDIKEKIYDLKETNPMMGHRGVRLAITYPEIYEMQTEAIISSALKVQKELNINIIPEIMIPLVVDLKEFLYVKNIIEKTAIKTIKNGSLNYKIGTMIETPRAVIMAKELAENCDFISFGTNDLTQLTYGFSRDDSGKFIECYFKKEIFDSDIFVSIDELGVGKLIEYATETARKCNPNIQIGVCGEQAGDPKSIQFFKKIGIDYVSCSVFRVPTAILSSKK